MVLRVASEFTTKDFAGGLAPLLLLLCARTNVRHHGPVHTTLIHTPLGGAFFRAQMKAVTEMPVLGGEATGCILHHFQAVKVIRIRANTRAHMHRAWVRATDGRRVLPKKYKGELAQTSGGNQAQETWPGNTQETNLFPFQNPKP